MPVELCTMCRVQPATTRYGAPVCQGCYNGLVELQGKLEELEAQDPELRALGERIEEL